MQFLAIDQGNTRTKFGLFVDGSLLRAWTCDTSKSATVTELAAAAFGVRDHPSGIPLGLCTVTPELLDTWRNMAAEAGSPLTIFTGQSPTPLALAYATPETLGADRLLAAVAATRLVGTPVLPVSLGTATVVDAVSADGVFLGGLIAPGIGTAAQALAGAASALWRVEWRTPKAAIGQSSAAALANGWFYHSVGSVRAMVRASRDELGVEAPIALTGGWAAHLAPHLDGVALHDEYLVLHGIAMMME